MKTLPGESYALDADLGSAVLADRVYTIRRTLALYLDDMSARLQSGEVDDTPDLQSAVATAQAIISGCDDKIAAIEPPTLTDTDLDALRSLMAQLQTEAESLEL